MTITLERPEAQQSFEKSDQERRDIIETMDHMYEDHSDGIIFNIRSRLLARKAAALAQKDEVYPMQAFDLATRLAALNPKLEKTAHSIIEKKFANKTDMPKPLADLTYQVVEKTVEKSFENEDDTATLPRLVIAADSELTEELISHFPPSEELQKIANSHESHPEMRTPKATSNTVATGVYRPTAEV